jgi:hypothetical protein
MESFKIAIPSLGRFNKLKTLPIANEIVGEDNVFVFLHNDEELSRYQVNYKANYIVTNLPIGIAGQRNAILNHFQDKEKIVMLNDDITEFYELGYGELLPLSPKEIFQRFNEAFSICEKEKAYLWGVYPIKNHFYMSDKIITNGFIIGSVMGIINNSLRFDESFHTKEDYDFTLQNLMKYRKVMRFDNLTMNATHSEKSGGGCSYAYQDGSHKEACEKILKKWGKFVRRNRHREDEIIINTRSFKVPKGIREFLQETGS